MIAKLGNIITDGHHSKRVPAGFSAWHSDMAIGDVPGEDCHVVAIPAHADVGCVASAAWEGHAARVAAMPKLRRPPLRGTYRRPRHTLG